MNIFAWRDNIKTHIIAKYLGPVFVVAAARIYANTAKHNGITIWKYRSPVRSMTSVSF